MVRLLLLGVAATTLAGCGEFETRSIVLDLRILAMTVTPPEVIVAFDPAAPMAPTELELPDVRVCALLANPMPERLQWTLRACAPTDDGRCDEPGRPQVEIGDGIVDPAGAASVEACGTLVADASLLLVLEDAIAESSISGFGGVPVQLELSARALDAPADATIFGTKQVLYSPELPPGRVANRNPTLEAWLLRRIGGEELALPLGACDAVEPPVVAAGELIELEPVESPGAREDYVLPTFDGDVREFTENLSYDWYATSGDFEAEVTGGTRDFAGNEPVLYTEWQAPDDAGPVPLWLVQRDERGGSSYYRSCVQVR